MEPADQRDDRTRRLYAPVLIVGLLGAIGMSVGSAKSWASATGDQPGLPTIHAIATGSDLAPLAAALGVVALAGFGAVIATRGWVRRGIGVLIAASSAVVLILAITPDDPEPILRSGLSAKGWTGAQFDTAVEPWRWIVLAAAVVSLVAGAATARFGATWAVMGTRYDAPGRPAEPRRTSSDALSETEVWQAIDRGDDPTQGI